jgi:glucose-6-phosphate-specific signal transduction histidine kinase
LLVFASGYAVHRYRVGRRLEIERVRTRNASDLQGDPNNIVRHAGATGVTIEVTIGAQQLRVTVSDDGRGVDTSTAAEGQGLRNMLRRCGSLGGSLDVMFRPGRDPA